MAAALPLDDADADTEDIEDALDAPDETMDHADDVAEEEEEGGGAAADDAEEEGAEDEVTDDEARRRAADGDADRSLSSCAGSDRSRRKRLGA